MQIHWLQIHHVGKKRNLVMSYMTRGCAGQACECNWNSSQKISRSLLLYHLYERTLSFMELKQILAC